MRFFLDIAYNGTAYHGWQIQKNAPTVQEALNNVLSKILTKGIETVGSGRTDTGVHAIQQIVHLDTEVNLLDDIYLHKLKLMLPKDISIQSIQRVKDDAHARFDAILRSYEYRILKLKNPFLTDLAYHFSQELDMEKMNEAASLLLKETNFESFSKVKTEVWTFNCNIIQAEWIRKDDQITFFISADRFLRGMVRALVGTMLEVGLHRLSIGDFQAIIHSKDRRNAGRSVPPQGLFLTSVRYPDNIFVN